MAREIVVDLKISPSAIGKIKDQINNIKGTAQVGLKLKPGDFANIQKSIKNIKANAQVGLKLAPGAKSAINAQIKALQPKTPIKVNLKIGNEKDFTSGAIGKRLQKNFGTFKVKELDSKRAIASFRQRLQKEVDFVGDATSGKGTTSGTKESLKDAEKMKKTTAEWQGQLKSVGAIMSTVSDSYKKAAKILKGGDLEKAQSEFFKINESYQKFKDAGKTDSSDDHFNTLVKSANEYRTALDGMIAKERESQRIAKETAAAEKAAAKEKAKASKEEETANAKRLQAEKQIAALNQKVETTLRKNSRLSGTQYESQLRALTGGLNADDKNFKDTITKRNLDYSNIISNASAAGKMGQSFMGRLSQTYQRLVSYGVITSVFFQISNAMRSVYDNVVNIDTAMTQLRKVTDETDATYDKFFDGVNDRAKNIGATMADTINASADFARLGYDIDTASQMADAALVYKNVGDNITDISQASESLTSTIQAFKSFGIEASDAMGVVDRFNEVGKDYCPAA